MAAPSKAMAKTTEASGPEPSEQEIVRRIYTAVMEQRLAPNTKLSEPILCQSFGVGRMRVRRALLLLSDQGIVELHANRGAFVACPDAGEAADVFEARRMIEPELVARLADTIRPEDLEALRGHIASEDDARQRGARIDLIRLTGEFHVRMARLAGNAVLERVVTELVTRSSLITGIFGDSEKSSCPDDEHARILGALERNDPELARDLVRRHLDHIQAGLDLNAERESVPDLVQILRNG